ncbi:MAG: hypothetical protein ACREPV_06980 [Lysobacter sp.]
MQTPMRAIPIATAALLVLALSGCPDDHVRPDSPPPADPDGVPCSQSAGAAAVWIDIEGSTSSIHPSDETCTVDPDTQITWRSAEAFHLRFPGANPGGAGVGATFDSTAGGRRYHVRIDADNASGSYEYEIVSGNVVVDPVIIIRNRN